MRPNACGKTASLRFAGWGPLVFALWTPWLIGCEASSAIRPNLVLITVDAVRPDQLVCYGAEQAIGAEACALGDEGALYEWAFSTAPSGAPAAASVLTSSYPGQHGVGDDPATFLPYLGPPTLAEQLEDAGYATGAFVSSPELNRSRHFDRGFQHWDEPGDATGPGVGERARAWTARAPAPWFIWVHFSEPHGPFEGQGERPAAGRDAAAPETYRAAYRGALRRLDRQLSKLIAVLDNETPPPGILLTALHGQELGGRDAPLGHGTSLLPPQIHVPLLWRSPRSGGGTSVGRRIAGPVSLVDVGPTLLEAAGVRAPVSFVGVPLPHSESAESRAGSARRLFAEQPEAVAVIQGDALAVFPRSGPLPAGRRPRRPPARVESLRLPIDSHAPSARPDPRHLERALLDLPTDWSTRGGE